MCYKAVNIYDSTIPFAPDCYKAQEKLLIDVFLKFFIFLIDIKLKKCVIELFPKILLC